MAADPEEVMEEELFAAIGDQSGRWAAGNNVVNGREK